METDRHEGTLRQNEKSQEAISWRDVGHQNRGTLWFWSLPRMETKKPTVTGATAFQPMSVPIGCPTSATFRGTILTRWQNPSRFDMELRT